MHRPETSAEEKTKFDQFNPQNKWSTDEGFL